jgi:hypothetical protein
VKKKEVEIFHCKAIEKPQKKIVKREKKKL